MNIIRITIQLLVFLSVLVLTLSCSEIQDKDIPGYVYFDKPLMFNGNDTLENQIKDVWVYHGQLYHGTFQTPAKIPFVHRHIDQFIVLPGVWANDAPLEKKIYPFLQPETLKKALTAEEVHHYQPTFRYFPFDSILEIPFQEDFEGNAIKFTNIWVGRDTALLKRSENAFQGRYCGKVEFDSTHRSFVVASTGNPFRLHRTGFAVWAEVTYRGNIKFRISLDGEYTITPGLTPSLHEWKTVYFDLTNQFLAIKDVQQDFRLFLSALTDGTNRELYLDNIRIIQFRP